MAGLQPAGNAVEVKCVIADTPRHGALLGRRRSLVGLTLDAKVHDVVAANGAVVDDNVPGPESDGIPLLDFELLLALSSTLAACLDGLGLRRRSGRVGHVNISHVGLLEEGRLERVQCWAAGMEAGPFGGGE